MLKYSSQLGPNVEFFSIASPEIRVRMESLFGRGKRPVTDIPASEYFVEGQRPPKSLPAFLRGLALWPSGSELTTRILRDILTKCVGSENDRCPVVRDILWTWISAWTEHSRSPVDFAEAFSEPASREAFRDIFLLSELARATVLSSQPERTAHYLAPAIRILTVEEGLADSVAEAFGRYLARLVFGATRHSVDSSSSLALTDASISAGPRCAEAFRAEADICEFILDAMPRGEGSGPPTSDHLSTSLALAELSQASGDGKPHAWTEPGQLRYERISNRVGQLLASLQPEERWEHLNSLAASDDVFMRCAAISHALAATKDVSWPSSKEAAHDRREVVKGCVVRALGKQSHHWLKGAALQAYCNVTRPDHNGYAMSKAARWMLPPITTFGFSKEILVVDEDSPPGLQSQIRTFRAERKCIALVLPGITPFEKAELRQINKGSPPLGLGQIASHLSAKGHLVHLYDAHRYSYSDDRLVSELSNFDVIGVSIVFSTIRSAASLTAAIRSSGRLSGPKIVVGGHAPTLMTAQRIKAAGVMFDYVAIGPGEEAFDRILEDIQKADSEPQPPHVVSGSASVLFSENPYATNRELAVARSATTKMYQSFIDGLPWMDRSFFADPISGKSYEPTETRNGVDTEAHVVLSRGCDWRCSFCTEALIAGKQGENRRTVQDVSGEIAHLRRHSNVNRVQFIDDNVFPTLPAYKRRIPDSVADARAWTEALLAALIQIDATSPKGSKLRWRGLMRIEDFFHYEELVPDFVQLLAQSGCHLLAFGLECGSEAARAKMKGTDEHSATNADIAGMISRLQAAGIFVKGYFIVGGPGQTRADTEETIEFAISSNLDLAYFAIYKDFRGIAQAAGSDASADAVALRFQLFSSAMLDARSILPDSSEWQHQFGSTMPVQERTVHLEALRQLQLSGFSFDDLVRYNDYHEWMDPYTEMGFADHKDYLQTLSQAYLRFYARRDWLPRYQALVESGY